LAGYDKTDITKKIDFIDNGPSDVTKSEMFLAIIILIGDDTQEDLNDSAHISEQIFQLFMNKN
jgi:hypothetical protein